METLNDEQTKLALLKSDAAQRTGWHFIPKPFTGEQARCGVTIKSMNETSRAAALKLLAAGLSDAGFQQVQKVMSLEGILAKIEGPVPNRAWTRDPEMYYFTVFGKPGEKRWGWRCEGHHVSLNFVVEGDKLVSATPSFLGANPGEVPSGPDKGLRVLERREDLARSLLKSCDEKQHAVVLQDPKAPDDLRGGGAAQPDQTPAVGLAFGDMTEQQQKLMQLLLETYTENMAPDIASTWMKDLNQAGREKIKFAWWGEENRGQRHYYRVQGPTFLIEYNNTQNGANHVHSMWRDTKGDFGIPL